MIVYADIVFIINFIADWLVIRTAALCLHRCILRRRIAACSAFGGIYAVAAAIYPLLSLGVVKLAVSAAIVWIVFGERTLKGMVKVMTVFYTAAFILCGIVSAVSAFFTADMIAFSVNRGNMGVGLSLGVFAAASIIAYMAMPLLQKLFARHAEKPCRAVEVEYNGARVKTQAMLDTGNTLCEPVSQTAAVVADKSLSREIIGGKSPEELDGVRVIPYRTISGGGIMYAVKVRVTVDDEHAAREVYMAMSERTFDGYHMLM